MEPKFQSSFIPKGPIAQEAGTAKFTHVSDRTVLGTLAVFVFTFAVLLSLGVFGYQLYLKSRINKMGGDLALARQSLEPETIKKISDLDGRIVSTKNLLDKHVVLSPLFDYLEASTVRNLRFKDVNYESGDKGINVIMNGEATSYAAIALQSEIFNRDGSPFKDVVFSNLSLDDRGNVSFTMKAAVNPTVISYQAEVSTQPAIVPVAPPVLVPVSTTTDSTASSTSQ